MGLFSPKYSSDEDETAGAVFHFPTSKKALIIFTRNPELGKVKTRLAATIGNKKALEIYTFLIAHTIEITHKISVDKYVFYSEKIAFHDAWENNVFRKKRQTGKNLGERMHHAFQELFTMGYEQVMIVGSDIYELSQRDIEEAFTALESHRFVIGPAQDGGYYLLGMKQFYSPLFQNKKWGSETVLQDTLSDLQTQNYMLLPVKNDVDYYEDIKDEEVFKSFLK